ncbi:hypothetical protein H6P81_020926 [Aristolochia fimbriata]|uniref:Uncharacterized protein n=1 Tax=Aristolochia fimbriata TaxID=158543 RepID=A0AAV7DYU5_ARIFI|nr:hypothetical protein H6P81_020926 [Aristolochia fimbriata]
MTITTSPLSHPAGPRTLHKSKSLLRDARQNAKSLPRGLSNRVILSTSRCVSRELGVEVTALEVQRGVGVKKVEKELEKRAQVPVTGAQERAVLLCLRPAI